MNVIDGLFISVHYEQGQGVWLQRGGEISKKGGEGTMVDSTSVKA